MRGTTLAQAEIKAYNTFLIHPPDVRAAWPAGLESERTRHGKHPSVTEKAGASTDAGNRQILPFAVVGATGPATLLLPPFNNEPGHFVVAGIFFLLVLAMARLAPDSSRWQVAPPLIFFLVIAVVRDGSGGASSGLAPLVALPILWVALYRSRVEVFFAAAATGLVFIAPLLLVGPPAYLPSDWRRALLWTLIAALVGPVVQNVVRRLAEREQQQAVLAAQLDAVLNGATEHSIIATDVDGTISTFNHGAERLLGYRADEVVGKETPALIHDPDEVAHRAQELGLEPGFEVLVSAARRAEHETREWTYLAKDGSKIPVRLAVTALRDPGGAIFGFLGIATDIAAEKAALSEVRAVEQRWKALLDHLPDTTVLTVDEGMLFGVALGAGLARQGLSGASGKTLYETSSPENIGKLEPAIRAALAGEEAQTEIQATLTGLTNEVTVVPLPLHAGKLEALLVARDVTESRHREDLLTDAKERFASLFEEAPFGVMVCDLAGITQEVNAAACAMVGRTRDELIGKPASLAGGDPQRLKDLTESFVHSPSGRVSSESRLRHKEGHMIDISFDAIVMKSKSGAPQEILINAVDVSERRRLEAELAHLAHHDPLTSLANRRMFYEEFDHHLQNCERYGPRGALLMMDLDHFKQVNDTLGHAAGDQLLVAVAELLRIRLRKSDVLARLGGDEFAFLLPEADRASAEQVAADIVHLVRDTASSLGGGARERHATASIGVVLIERTGMTASELVRIADLTMYGAKKAGRDRYAMAPAQQT